MLRTPFLLNRGRFPWCRLGDGALSECFLSFAEVLFGVAAAEVQGCCHTAGSLALAQGAAVPAPCVSSKVAAGFGSEVCAKI